VSLRVGGSEETHLKKGQEGLQFPLGKIRYGPITDIFIYYSPFVETIMAGRTGG
jgi:hypothetical protein